MRSIGLSNVQVHVGRQNVTANVYQDTPYSEQYNIADAVTHPYYDEVNGINDIGYVRTTTNVRFR